MFRHIIVMLSVCFPVLLLGGCATVYTQTHSAYGEAIPDCSLSRTIPNIYSGTVLDLYGIPAENAGFFFLIDLPLSLVADTVIIPLTGYRQIKHGNWYDLKSCAASRNGNTDEPVRSRDHP